MPSKPQGTPAADAASRPRTPWASPSAASADP